MFRRYDVPKEEKEAFGRVIRAHREIQGYTQEGLAGVLGWSAHWISDIENGKSIPAGLGTVRLLAALDLESKQALEEAGLRVPVPAD